MKNFSLSRRQDNEKKRDSHFGGPHFCTSGSNNFVSSKTKYIFECSSTEKATQREKEKQLAYLKEHDNEIKEFVKSQNPKIESVQIDWDQTRWEDKIGNGTPQGAGKVVSIFGGFNHLKTSDWNVLIEIKNGKIDMESMGISNSIRLEGQLFD